MSGREYGQFSYLVVAPSTLNNLTAHVNNYTYINTLCQLLFTSYRGHFYSAARHAQCKPNIAFKLAIYLRVNPIFTSLTLLIRIILICMGLARTLKLTPEYSHEYTLK